MQYRALRYDRHNAPPRFPSAPFSKAPYARAKAGNKHFLLYKIKYRRHNNEWDAGYRQDNSAATENPVSRSHPAPRSLHRELHRVLIFATPGPRWDKTH